MTKLYKYILNESNVREMEKDEVFSLVKKNCKPILKEMKKHFLYRTIANYIIAGIGKTYSNRKPVDTDIDLHNRLNEWFKDNFGWKARSNNVLFVYGKELTHFNFNNKSNAFNSYMTFPVGKFKYIWSPKIYDLTVSLDDELIYDERDHFSEFMKEADYRTDGFSQAIKSGNEIMIKCKEYYMINLNNLSLNELEEKLL